MGLAEVVRMRLNVLAVGVGAGVAWGLCVLLPGLISIGGWGVEMVEMLGTAYIGFDTTGLGAIIGAL